MILPKITGRRRGAGEEYLPIEGSDVKSDVKVLKGDGKPETPYCLEVNLINTGKEAWEGILQFSFYTELKEPRFFLPGFMYGTNRGEAPLEMPSPCAKLRENMQFPAAPWWMVRSDRLSHPVALVYGENRVKGIVAPPYFVKAQGKIEPWHTKEAAEFYQYGGFGCALENACISYTLGYENAPWMFIESHHTEERAPLSGNCFVLETGESLSFCVEYFDFEAEDERGVHDALKKVYDTCHEVPRRVSSIKETVTDIASAIAEDAWLPEKHSYSCFVFDKGESFEYRELPSIAWTNGLAAAVPMLEAACRLNSEPMRVQALECVEHIVKHSLNEKVNLPYMAETEKGWSNRGWWYDGQHVPGHSSYLVGQCVYFVLKAYALEKKYNNVIHNEYLAFAEKVIGQTEKTRNSDGEYPYIFSDRTGAGLEYDSFSGAWCLAATAYYSYLTGEKKYLEDLLFSEEYYHDMYVRHQECYGGPLDISKGIDSEGILAYIRAVRYLHEITRKEYLLEHLRDGLHYEFTFKFCYNSPIKVPPLSNIGWSSCGGSITSVTNPHIHPMSSSVVDEMIYYTKYVDDTYVYNRLQDTILWSCQTYNTYPKEYGYGKKGWMSERYCHSEGLLKETYPDGSPASTWFALMPWAAGCILEGLAGEAWTEE